MPRHEPLYQWADRVTTHFPDLPRPTAFVLALWAFGMVLAHACGLTAVALHLASLLGQSVNTVRQRLREFYQPAGRKAGRGRTELDPATCCSPLVRWITAGWSDRRVALALDVTNFGERFHVLACAIAYRGCAVPVAWTVLAGGRKEEWHPHWCALLSRVAAVLGPGWEVIVLTDRGLESPRLFREITGHGWHPLMRVKTNGKFRPDGWHRFYTLGSFAAREGQRFAARGTAYTGERLPSTLLACRRAGCEDAWLLLTDLGPGAADPCWYAFRSWIEQGFKVIKSGGWDWEATRITAPDRAARQWVVLAVATLWLIEVGGLAECEPRPETVPPWPAARSKRSEPRPVRLFRLGLGMILAGIIVGSVPVGQFIPEAWPVPQPVPEIREHEFCQQMTYP
jgi:Transposase DDE domain